VVDYAMAKLLHRHHARDRLRNNGGLDYSAALSYRTGRKDKDVSSDSISSGSDELRGMGEIKARQSLCPGWSTG
jgi:hypothetical protein